MEILDLDGDVDHDEWMSKFRLGICLIHCNFTILYSSFSSIPNLLMYSTSAPAWLQILNYLPDAQSLEYIAQAISINGQELARLNQDYSIPRGNLN